MQIKTKIRRGVVPSLIYNQQVPASDQFIEVCLEPFLYEQATLYIKKHFREHVKFKHTLILLEDQSLKKTYLLNRLFYAKYALHPFYNQLDAQLLLEKILAHAHLPVVFKESSQYHHAFVFALVHKIEIQAIYLHSRVVFYYTHFLAREFLQSLFAPHILLETPFEDKSNKSDFLHETHAHLDALEPLMALQNSYFKHACIHFIYPTQALYLTRQEEVILKALRTLGLGVMHSKEEIKHRYLELAKLYHPDACTTDSSLYKQRFLEIVEAYGILKQL
ncbi:J domain-containing protein [Helicobacter cynogastricus]|uniref:J domain-containing protein n=1 Tax=Helicobacter cynogastricus TaxID=329937 RepID=UPI0018F7F7F0|nr:J domain-containing protein [Helicobacter cynogastricus]